MGPLLFRTSLMKNCSIFFLYRWHVYPRRNAFIKFPFLNIRVYSKISLVGVFCLLLRLCTLRASFVPVLLIPSLWENSYFVLLAFASRGERHHLTCVIYKDQPIQACHSYWAHDMRNALFSRHFSDTIYFTNQTKWVVYYTAICISDLNAQFTYFWRVLSI